MAKSVIHLDNEDLYPIPGQAAIEQWVNAALRDERASAELSISIVSSNESQQLNHDYRGKDRPTNVLSFPAEFPDGVEVDWLGDLVICADVVEREAIEQNKASEAHWAHMIVHGTLHLLGYDHVVDTEAEFMEQLETDILINLGYPAPYEL